MTISALLVSLLVSVVIPAAVALLTKLAAAVWLKQGVAAVLAAVTGLLTTATQLDGTAVISKASVVLALGTFLASQAAYLGLYRPHDANAIIAPGVGLGPSSPTVS